MPLRHVRRPLALFALAFALLAALPCAAVVGDDASCCGTGAHCADAIDSPCARLAAAPCCGAPQSPVSASPAPPVESPPAGGFGEFAVVAAVARAPSLEALRRPAPRALADHLTIRDVLLRL
jgi:hypothetical protein